jgi:hypothetical protein
MPSRNDGFISFGWLSPTLSAMVSLAVAGQAG